MKKLSLIISLAGFFGFLVILSSCNKDNAKPDTEFTAAADDAYAEQVFDNVTNIADEAYDASSNGFKSTEGWIYLGDCATVTLDTTSFPYLLTIDFGDTNCLCNDGRYRRGKILVSFTGRYYHPGTIITTTFDQYYVNDNQVEGIKTITNMGFNDGNNMYWDITVNGVITLANDGGTITWDSQREREWIDGIQTRFNKWDDKYLITGTATGKRANGLHWTKTIVSPLRIELACRFIVSGTVNIQPEGRALRVLDFGDGTCDNIATVTVNGTTYTIYLRP